MPASSAWRGAAAAAEKSMTASEARNKAWASSATMRPEGSRPACSVTSRPMSGLPVRPVPPLSAQSSAVTTWRTNSRPMCRRNRRCRFSCPVSPGRPAPSVTRVAPFSFSLPIRVPEVGRPGQSVPLPYSFRSSHNSLTLVKKPWDSGPVLLAAAVLFELAQHVLLFLGQVAGVSTDTWTNISPRALLRRMTMPCP